MDWVLAPPTLNEKLNVNGAINIGNTAGTNAGTIRYTGSDFEGYFGGAWHSFTGSDADWTISGSNMYSAVSGNVGIGTTSPIGKLHVQGTVTTSQGVYMNFTGSANNFNGLFLQSNSTHTGGQTTTASFSMTGSSGVTNSMGVDVYNNATATNNYGVNSAVAGSGTNNYGIRASASNGYTSYGVYSVAQATTGSSYGVYSWAHGTGGVNYGIRASANGASSQNWAGWFGGTFAADGHVYIKDRLGLGTTTLNERLNVNGGINIGYTAGTNAGTIRYTGSDFEGYFGGAWHSLTGSDADWTISGSNMYSSVSGNVGVGVTSPIAKLQVGGTLSSSTGFLVNVTGNTTSTFTGMYSSAQSTVASSTVQSLYLLTTNSSGAAKSIGAYAYNDATATSNYGFESRVLGAGTSNYGMYSYASGGTTSTGIYAEALATTGNSYGLNAWAHGTGSTNYGVKAATMGGTSNWAGWFGGSYMNDGKVYIEDMLGIGTTTLSEKLNVNGAINIGNTTGTNAGTIRYTGSDFEGYFGGAWHSLTSSSDGDWTVSGSNMYSAVTGNVGIGTSAPSQKLDVLGNIKMPATTSTSGILYAGNIRFLHNYGNKNVFLGENAGNLSLSTSTAYGYNVGIGSNSLFSLTSGKWNTAVGTSSMYGITTGYSNVAVGINSLYANTTGYGNVAIGTNALRFNVSGHNNTDLGYYAGYSNSVGSNNVFIGEGAGYSETGSNKLYSENSTTTAPLIWGDFLTNDAAINGNLSIGSQTFGAGANNVLAIFNGTAPTASVLNGVQLYAQDVSASSELKVRDEAGNITVLSPHEFSFIPAGPSEEMSWAFYSERNGRVINVDMARVVRLVEQLSGEQLIWLYDKNTGKYIPSVQGDDIRNNRELKEEIEQLKAQNREILERLERLENK